MRAPSERHVVASVKLRTEVGVDSNEMVQCVFALSLRDLDRVATVFA